MRIWVLEAITWHIRIFSTLIANETLKRPFNEISSRQMRQKLWVWHMKIFNIYTFMYLYLCLRKYFFTRVDENMCVCENHYQGQTNKPAFNRSMLNDASVSADEPMLTKDNRLPCVSPTREGCFKIWVIMLCCIQGVGIELSLRWLRKTVQTSKIQASPLQYRRCKIKISLDIAWIQKLFPIS